MSTAVKPTKQIAEKILKLLRHGLVKGLGEPVPGRMCVEAAVCYAFGLPHSDKPPCVGAAVRAFKIRLNDARWSSNKSRSDGLRRLAVAQLGSNEIDQVEFMERLAFRIIKEILPLGLRAAAKCSKIQSRKDRFLQAASECEAALDLITARNAAADAAYAASAYAAADYAAASAASAVAYASAYADDAYARDKILMKAAEIAVDVLIELKSPGRKWLKLA